MDTRIKDHQNLFNADCNAFFYSPEIWQPEGGPYSKKAIFNFVRLLKNSGVDTFLVNPNAQQVWYPSRKLPTALDGYTRQDAAFVMAHAKSPEDAKKMTDMLDLYLDLIEDGTDWLEEASKACRAEGISPWLSIRMNDLHGNTDLEKSFMNCPLFRENPGYRIRYPLIPKRGGKSLYGLDYNEKAVRDYFFSIIEEVVSLYDYEGIELDFTRHPVLMEPVATKSQLDMMTAWIREIRELTLKKAAFTGRSYPMGARIPPELEMDKSIGIDISRWVREGLLDFIIPVNVWPTAWDIDYDMIRKELGNDVAVYGGIENAPNFISGYLEVQEDQRQKDPYRSNRFMSVSPEFLRGNAAGKLIYDIDGIEVFNFFCTDVTFDHVLKRKDHPYKTDYSVLKNLHDLKWLKGKNKLYSFSTLARASTVPFESVEQLPVILEEGWRRSFRVPMAREPQDRGMVLEVQVITEKRKDISVLGLSFNGSWPVFKRDSTDELLFENGPYKKLSPAYQGYNFTFEVSKMKEGFNELTVYHGDELDEISDEEHVKTLRIEGIEIALKAKETI